MKRLTWALCSAVLALPFGTSAADAQTARMPTHGAASAAPAANAHRYFGALVGVSGQLLVVQLRNGQMLRVNAAQAFALKRVSEPFFLRKPVVVDGVFHPDGVLYATAVKRGVALVRNWGVDR